MIYLEFIFINQRNYLKDQKHYSCNILKYFAIIIFLVNYNNLDLDQIFLLIYQIHQILPNLLVIL